MSNFYVYVNVEEALFIHQKYSTVDDQQMIMKLLIYSEANKAQPELLRLNYLLSFSTTA